MPDSRDVFRKKIVANLLAGLSVEEIAEATNESVEAVMTEVADIFRAWQIGQDTASQVDLARLNRAINAIWGDVQAGNLNAVDTLVRIINQRQRLVPDPFPASPAVPGQVKSREAYALLEQYATSAPWWDDYQGLLAEVDDKKKPRWGWRKAVFIAWSSMPGDRRWPSTQVELATGILGLNTDRTIRQWRQKDAGIDEKIAEMSGAHILFKYRSATFHALGQSASDPDPRGHADRKLLLEITGDYTPKQKVEQSGPAGGPISHHIDYSDFSEAELDKLIDNLQTAVSQLTLGQDPALTEPESEEE